MKKLLLFQICAFILLVSGPNFSALRADIVLDGHAYGDNLLVYNPFTNKHNHFSVSSVSVNGKEIGDIAYSTIEIDFITLGIDSGAAVSIIIKHNPVVVPVVLNAEVLKPPCEISFSNAKFNKKNNNLEWSVPPSDCAFDFIIEQYRWERWMKIGQVNSMKDTAEHLYALDAIPHSGSNLFRIRYATPRGKTVFSHDIKYRSPERAVMPSVDKAGTKVSFSYDTLYEMYNEGGKLVRSGYGPVIDIANLTKGIYIMSYDNETVMIAKQ